MKNVFVALNAINICSDKYTLEPYINVVAVRFVNANMILEVSEDKHYTSKLGESISHVYIINGEEYLVLGSPEEIICEIHKEEEIQLC